MKVAVVRNHENRGVIGRWGQPSPEKYAESHVQGVVDALREGGHTVAVFEGDMTLPASLEQFMPSDAAAGLPTGMVFNMAYGIQGQCRYTHVPALLEAAGVPYTGASPFGHVLSQDKVISKILMRDAGISTPAFQVASHPDCDLGNLCFPLIVKPRHESCVPRFYGELNPFRGQGFASRRPTAGCRAGRPGPSWLRRSGGSNGGRGL